MRILSLVLLAALCTAGDPPATPLVIGGKAALPVVIAPAATPAVRASAEEFARLLGRMGGATVAVETGDGSRGIVVGRPADFAKLPFAAAFDADPFHREDYRLRSQADGLWLLGASDLAVSHATWDVLHRLGHRQFFPGATWEVIPPPRDLALAVDASERPAYAARRIWYNWGLWGYNDAPYHQWCVRNRMTKGFDLQSGHSYEAIIAANADAFAKHPEWLAQLGGERKMRGDIKFCVANPGLRTLIAEHTVRHFTAHPEADSISLDPSDGGGWCECADCARFPRISDRVVTLANVAAEAAEKMGGRARYVGTYAYNRHTAPPTIKVHPKVIVSATTAFLGDGYSHEQVLAGWQKQGATMGVYDYLSVVDWDWNLPRGGKGGRPAQLAEELARHHRLGARFYDAESGDCWGPCGLGYYLASRMLWNLDATRQVAALTEDFLTRAFPGGALEPMRAFYQLTTMDDQRRSASDQLARMYRHLDAARRATQDAAVRARLDALALWTRHVELYTDAAAGRRPVGDVARHDWRMRETMMVHSYGLWCRLLDQGQALDPKHPLKDATPIGVAEIDGFIAAGIAAHQPVDPGFAGVTFSTELVPAAPRLTLNQVPAGRFPDAAQDQQRWWLWLPEAGKGLDLEITVRKAWANRMPKVTLFSPQEVSLNPVVVDETPRPDNQKRTLHLRTPYGGLHRLETLDGGDYTTLGFPAIPLTLESGIDTPTVTSHFRGGWTLSFYVPKGTKVVGGWASRIANWAPQVGGRLLAGDGSVVHDFGGKGDGWFKVAVPPGQDGKLWTFVDSQGQRLLMTVPPFLARSGAELLLPREVVEADAGARP